MTNPVDKAKKTRLRHGYRRDLINIERAANVPPDRVPDKPVNRKPVYLMNLRFKG